MEGAETLPTLAALQSKVISSVETLSGFSDTTSDDEFVAYLKKEGLKEKDCSKMIGTLQSLRFTLYSRGLN